MNIGFVVVGNCTTTGKRNIGQVLTDTTWFPNCVDVDIRGGQITSSLGGTNLGLNGLLDMKMKNNKGGNLNDNSCAKS